MKFSKLFLIALLGTGLLASCGGSEEATPAEDTPTEETSATSTENNEESTAAEEGISQVTIEASDDMVGLRRSNWIFFACFFYCNT